MNCKPGDICVVLPPQSGYCNFTGALAEVIEPLRDNQIYPDIGLAHHVHKAENDEWLCRFIGVAKEFVGTKEHGALTAYGRMWDHRLRPINGGEPPEESLEAMRLLTQIPNKVTT